MPVLLLAVMVLLTGCKDVPSGSQYDEQYDKVRTSVKDLLGQEYEAVNFRVTKEGYTTDDKKNWEVDFMFDLNKPYTLLGATIADKEIPGSMKFEKQESGWVCTSNSGDLSGILKLLK
ncbi:MAG: hypothetical protein HBSAPP04_18010 [Ignavibacteriaceae bacterium]|nr:MAG: hypothetical protein HBSAPP04_18010 [Ignavibacteriaceae bacterium]